MKRRVLLIPVLCLLCCLFLAGTAHAEETAFPVAVHAENGEDYSVSVACPAEASVFCASYNEDGRMLEVHAVDSGSDTPLDVQTDDASQAKIFALDKTNAPAADTQTVYFDGWEERDQYGDVCLDAKEYKKASAAYSQAIGMDGQQAEPYVGRGNATVLAGETEQSLAAARQDYETAKTLDETNAGAYLGLADISIRQGDYASAQTTLEDALEIVGEAPLIESTLNDLKNGDVSDSAGHVRRSRSYDEDGEFYQHVEWYYDELGRLYAWDNYDRDAESEVMDEFGFSLENRCKVEFEGSSSKEIKRTWFDAVGTMTHYSTFEYNGDGQISRQLRFNPDDTPHSYYVYQYRDGLLYRVDDCWPDGTMYAYEISVYDETGRLIEEIGYSPEGEVEWREVYD